MKIEQLYTGCLAEAAYYIESKGEVAIIDPLRETEQYVEKATANQARIKYVFETHFHADFVSGHIDLAKKTGASIVFGPNAAPEYDAYIAKDEEVFTLGDVKIRVLHTPGHTMESTTYLLIDEHGKEQAIFTGDTLFIGDVGRPDLAVKSDLTQEDLARHLYDSLHAKILTLPDSVMVYPGHGAGSACGKNMSSETYDTLGNQRTTNYALQASSKEEFVKAVTDGLMPPPQYFPKNVMMNKKGYANFDEILAQGNKALTPDGFEALVTNQGALMLDVRSADDYAEGHIPNSIFIGLDGGFAVWVGTLIQDLKQPLVLVAEPGREEEAITRLARVGYDHTLGYLEGGMDAWVKAGKEIDTVDRVSPEGFASRFEQGEVKHVADVRKKSEFEAQHIDGEQVENLPLDYINTNMEAYKHEDAPVYLHCKGGYRSMITASILKSRGIHNLVNIDNGFDAIENTSLKTTAFVCPSTLK